MQNLVRFLCAVLIAVAVGLLVYGIAVEPDAFRAPAGLDLLRTPTECIAWGIGMLVGGALLLVFFGGRGQGFDKPGQP